MKKKNISQLLKVAGLSRQEFADMCGVYLTTTYWPKPPVYAVTILEMYIECKRNRETVETIEALIVDIVKRRLPK